MLCAIDSTVYKSESWRRATIWKAGGTLSASVKMRSISCILITVALLFSAAVLAPHPATADGIRSLQAGEVRIHILPFNYNDAIIIECDSHFGVVDSGEDNASPDGSDPRYPLRVGTTIRDGHEDEVISYMKKIGVTRDNLDFYIGTHPHSDHVGSAPDIIEAFHPKRIYLPFYDDSLITDETRLWDNQYVYDRFIDAAKQAQSAYGACLIQHLRPSYADNADSNKGNPTFALGDAKIEILNYDEAYLQTKVPDANYFSYGVKVTAANGRSAFLAGDINNHTDGDGNGVGDEDRLKGTIGPVDLLKMGHHGAAGSNSSDYLRTILKRANGEDRCVVVQTGDFAILSRRIIDVLNEKGVRYFSAAEIAEKGKGALIADLTADGVNTNAENETKPVVREFSTAPYATLYLNGTPYKGTGWHKAKSGRLYFFGESGTGEGSSNAVTGCWTTLDGVKVYIEEDAEIIKYPHNDDVKPDTPSVDSGKRGWHKVGTDWVYYDSYGALTTGWLQLGQTWYYLRDSGIMAAGWEQVKGSYYYFDGSGAMRTGWLRQNGHWFYLAPSGSMVTGWLWDNSSWYYLHESGVMATGWEQVKGYWYFMNGSGAMLTGWQNVYGSWYFLQSSGAMRTGWFFDSGAWYYLKDSGAMATGWETVKGNRYYMNGSGAMQTGWLLSGNKWYFLDSSGSVAKGWRFVNGAWYYLDMSDGVMQTGVQDIDGKTYCLNSSGAMLVGWQRIKNTWYHFNTSGAMEKGKWIGNYYVGQDGVMVTNKWVGKYHVNANGLWDATDPSKGVVSSL